MSKAERPAIRLKPGRDKSVLHRHPWLFSGAVAERIGSPRPGDIVDVLAAGGEFLARGYYNPRSSLVVRLLTWEDEEVSVQFWRRRIQAAMARREFIMDDPQTTAYRLIFAESDGLPGLIVDRYDGFLVLQSLTLGIDAFKDTIVSVLEELVPLRGIYERSDVDIRRQEGLGESVGLLAGEEPPERLIIQEHGYQYVVDLRAGQKTGFYLDQRENRERVARYCSGAEVLNCFSYTGAFAVRAAAAGARGILNIESSAEALQLGTENMHLNGLRTPVEDVEGNAFQELRRLRDSGRSFDLVILDPPKFAFSRAQLNSATRGYKDINILGMRLLRPGGHLCTFSCSGLVSEDLFGKVLFGASLDAGREARVVERLYQAPDHPVLLTFPEGAYLKGLILRVE